MKFARVGERENVRNQELAATRRKKDIKLKVVKASFKIFNLFPISFRSFSWVFSYHQAVNHRFLFSSVCVVLFLINTTTSFFS